MKDLRHRMLTVGRPRSQAFTSIARQEGQESGRRSLWLTIDLYHVVKKGSSRDTPIYPGQTDEFCATIVVPFTAV